MKLLKTIILSFSFLFFAAIPNSHAQTFTVSSFNNSYCGSSQIFGSAQGSLASGYHYRLFVERWNGSSWGYYNSATELYFYSGSSYAYASYEVQSAGTYRVTGRQNKQFSPSIFPSSHDPVDGIDLNDPNPPNPDFTLNGSGNLNVLTSNGSTSFSLDLDASMTAGPVDSYTIRVIETTSSCGNIPGPFFNNSFSGTGHPPASFDMMSLITNKPNCANTATKYYKVTVLIEGPCHQGWISHEDCITLDYNGPLCFTGGGMSGLQEENTNAFQQTNLKKITTYPNPVSDDASITFEMDAAAAVDLLLYDARGTLITSVLNQRMLDKGSHNYQFEMADLPSGIYIYSLSENGQVRTGKLIKN